MLYFNLKYMQAHNAFESFSRCNAEDFKMEGFTLNLWTGEYYLNTRSNIESLKTRIGNFNAIVDLVNIVVLIANMIIGRITQDEEKMSRYYDSACYHPTNTLGTLFQTLPEQDASFTFEDPETSIDVNSENNPLANIEEMVSQIVASLKQSEETLGTEEVANIFAQLLTQTATIIKWIEKMAAEQRARTALLRSQTPARGFLSRTPVGQGGSAFATPKNPNNVFG